MTSVWWADSEFQRDDEEELRVQVVNLEGPFVKRHREAFPYHVGIIPCCKWQRSEWIRIIVYFWHLGILFLNGWIAAIILPFIIIINIYYISMYVSLSRNDSLSSGDLFVAVFFPKLILNEIIFQSIRFSPTSVNSVLCTIESFSWKLFCRYILYQIND